MYEANKKSTGIAYLLWFFLGGFGAHRFYLGESGTGAAILIITLGSILLSVVFIGVLTIWISIIWIFVDLFLIPGMVQKYNNQLAARLNA
jgi:TM2 domain-containing membrane protein YozV